MSEKTEQLALMYQHLIESEGGQHLMKWLRQTADEKRRGAVKLEPTYAYAELKYAEALDSVVDTIEINKRMGDVGKKR